MSRSGGFGPAMFGAPVDEAGDPPRPPHGGAFAYNSQEHARSDWADPSDGHAGELFTERAWDAVQNTPVARPSENQLYVPAQLRVPMTALHRPPMLPHQQRQHHYPPVYSQTPAQIAYEMPPPVVPPSAHFYPSEPPGMRLVATGGASHHPAAHHHSDEIVSSNMLLGAVGGAAVALLLVELFGGSMSSSNAP